MSSNIFEMCMPKDVPHADSILAVKTVLHTRQVCLLLTDYLARIAESASPSESSLESGDVAALAEQQCHEVLNIAKTLAHKSLQKTQLEVKRAENQISSVKTQLKKLQANAIRLQQSFSDQITNFREQFGQPYDDFLKTVPPSHQPAPSPDRDFELISPILSPKSWVEPASPQPKRRCPDHNSAGSDEETNEPHWSSLFQLSYKDLNLDSVAEKNPSPQFQFSPRNSNHDTVAAKPSSQSTNVLPPPRDDVPIHAVKIPEKPNSKSCLFCQVPGHWSHLCVAVPTLASRQRIYKDRNLCLNCGSLQHAGRCTLNSRACRWFHCRTKKAHHASVCRSAPYPITQSIVDQWVAQLRALRSRLLPHLGASFIPPTNAQKDDMKRNTSNTCTYQLFE